MARGGVPPLTGDDPQLDARRDHTGSELPLDLPLQDAPPALPKPILLQASEDLFQAPEEARTNGRAIVAAGALVIGLLTGFTGGFLVGQRGGTLPAPRVAADVPVSRSVDEAPRATPGAGRPAARTYTNAPVADTVAGSVEDPAVGRATAPPRAGAVGAPLSGSPRRPSTVRSTAVTDNPGALHIASRPAGASVFVDGTLAGKTPLDVADVKAGTHRVRLELPGHRTWETSVTVEAGARARVGASLER